MRIPLVVEPPYSQEKKNAPSFRSVLRGHQARQSRAGQPPPPRLDANLSDDHDFFVSVLPRGIILLRSNIREMSVLATSFRWGFWLRVVSISTMAGAGYEYMIIRAGFCTSSPCRRAPRRLYCLVGRDPFLFSLLADDLPLDEAHKKQQANMEPNIAWEDFKRNLEAEKVRRDGSKSIANEPTSKPS